MSRSHPALRLFLSFGFAAVSALGTAACGGSSSSADGTCSYGGHRYERDERFPAEDGCNTCVCEADGRASCTLLACETCDSIRARYAAAIDDAKACDPNAADSCSTVITEGLACGCQTLVNGAASESIRAAQAAERQYSAMSCGDDIVCGPCEPPTRAQCSAEGRCVRAEAACKVDGVVYESGASGIADPVSCNECQCRDGQLSCTEIGCPVPCPAGTAYGTQCAQCGPTDACEVVEHGCLPTCTDTCEDGTCLDNVCRNVCG